MISKLVTWFQLNYPSLVDDMRNCSHHSETSLNPYHLEGDVWSHTLLVMESGKKCSELMLFALMLHDVAKPLCRKENNGKVSFKGHEVYSAYISLDISKKYGFSKEEQQRIFLIIAHHTKILKLIESNDTQPLVLNLFKGDPDLLLDIIEITNHDGLGRIMDNYSEKLYFIDDYFNGVIESIINSPKLEKNKTMTCLIGLPASGKSYYLKNNKIPLDEIIERDSIVSNNNIELGVSLNKKEKDLIYSEIENKKETLINANKNIYIDMVNIIDRDRYMSIKHIPRNYKFKAIVFISSLSTIEKNTEKRDKKISKEYYDYLLKNSSLPLYDEFDEIYYIFN